jgi:beta-catenin-like protein 1
MERHREAIYAIRDDTDTQLNDSLLDLLVANLSRLNEAESTDSQGVFSILGVFENLLSFLPPLAVQIVQNTTLLPWLLKRVQAKEYDSNKQYASEVLSILLQGGREVVMRVWEADGVDGLINVMAVGASAFSRHPRQAVADEIAISKERPGR